MTKKIEIWEIKSKVIKKGIKIYLEPISNTEGRIVINNEGKITKGKIVFNISKKRKKDAPKWEDKINELYQIFYKQITEP